MTRNPTIIQMNFARCRNSNENIAPPIPVRLDWSATTLVSV